MHKKIKFILSDAAIIDAEVIVKGWVRTNRTSRNLSFVNVHDGTCFAALQVIADKSLENYDEVARLTTGCSVVVTGKIAVSAGKGQKVELQASRVEVLGWVEPVESYPMQAKRHTKEHLREHAHLRPRTNLIGAATRIRHSLAMAIHRFFDREDFFLIHTPIITGSDAEGAGNLFKVSTLDFANMPLRKDGSVDFAQDFFGKETFLTVTGQLAVENYCLALSRVYTFGPTFRAENSNTSRHLAEFWMVEPEIAFADLADDIELAERFLKFIFAEVLEHRADDMAFFNRWVDKGRVKKIEAFIKSPFEQLEYTDAITILQRAKAKFEYPVRWGMDLQSEHERYLAEKHIGRPVVIMNYPKEIKAFYMRLNADGKTVAAMDVIAPGIGEIIGGSQREERLNVLDQRILEAGMKPETYWWYRDLRRYGTVPHAGFGLGFERALSYLTGLDNVRDVIAFPRTRRNASF